MEKQIRITNGEHSPIRKQTLHVALQAFANAEGAHQTVHNVLLFLRQAQGIGSIYGWEIGVEHGMLCALIRNGATLKVHMLQQTAMQHSPFRMVLIELPFKFKLNHSNRLVHLSNQSLCLFTRRTFARKFNKGFEAFARVIGISLHGKGCQRNHINAITFFQRLRVCITKRQTNYSSHTRRITCRSPHPKNVMVPPLYV